MAIADFDLDGNLDLLAAFPWQRRLTLRRGDGQGGFGPPANIGIEGVQSHLLARDLSGNGAPDVVAVSRERGAIAIHRNDGGGGFTPWLELPAPGVEKLVVTDWDGDGRDDLLGIDGEGVFWLARTDAGFGPRQSLLDGEHWRSIEFGDLDGDGTIDLAAISLQDPTLAMVWGEGGGAALVQGYPLPRGPFDLAFELGDAPSVLLVLSDGPGALGRMKLGPDRELEPLVEMAPSRATEFERSRTGSEEFFGRGPSHVVRFDGALVQQEFPFPSSVLQVEEGDLDGDGVRDLVVRTSEGISLLFGRSQGFRAGHDLALAGPVVATLVADFDGDERLDTAFVLRGATPQIWSGKSGALRPLGDGPEFTFAASDAALADMDGDGHLDLVIGEFALDGHVAVLLGDGQGGFAPPLRSPAGPIFRLVVADLDGDGIPDLLATRDGGSALLFFRGEGDGSLIFQSESPLGGNTGDLAVLDFNQDGHLDLAVTLFSEGAVQLLANDGRGKLSPCKRLETAGGPISLETSDLDGDGRMDLIVAAYEGSAATLLFQRGDGSWARTDLPAPGRIWRALPLSLIGPRPAVLVVDELGGSELWARDESENYARVAESRPPPRDFLSAAVADLDGDGLLDLVSGMGQSARFVYGTCEPSP